MENKTIDIFVFEENTIIKDGGLSQYKDIGKIYLFMNEEPGKINNNLLVVWYFDGKIRYKNINDKKYKQFIDKINVLETDKQ